MTRINCGIPPAELSNKHLLAEHREIKRIPNAINKGKFNLTGQPPTFKLGTGHVKFFYDKLLYLKNRYESLYAECQHRGFQVTYYGSAWDQIPEHLLQDYWPSPLDIEIVRQRIKDRTKSD